MAILFLKGLLLGFTASISLGPISLSIIQKTVNNGRKSGLIAGFGAASADTLFALSASFGSQYFSNIFETYNAPLRLIGGSVVIAVGFSIILKNSSNFVNNSRINKRASSYYYLSTFLLAISNPLTIIMYSLILNIFEIIPSHFSILHSLALFTGIFGGAFLWWCLIVYSAKYLQLKTNFIHYSWANKVVGSLIISFGCISLLSALNHTYSIDTIFDSVFYSKFLSSIFLNS